MRGTEREDKRGRVLHERISAGIREGRVEGGEAAAGQPKKKTQKGRGESSHPERSHAERDWEPEGKVTELTYTRRNTTS